MSDADELMAEAEYCRRLAQETEALTRRILLEVAEQYEAQARLISAYRGHHSHSSGWAH